MRLDVELVAHTKRMIMLPGPMSVEELVTHYVHAADVLTVPKNVEKIEQDLGRVITLRVTVDTGITCGFSNTTITNRGYYAYGEKNKENVVFRTYVGYRSVTSDFPSKRLEDAIAKFMLRLVKCGYDVTEVDYKLPSSTN